MRNKKSARHPTAAVRLGFLVGAGLLAMISSVCAQTHAPDTFGIVAHGGSFGDGWSLHADDVIEGTGEFNGELGTEIVIRSSSALGLVGFNEIGRSFTQSTLGVGQRFGGAWLLKATDRIEGLGDFDGDGVTDVLIRSDTHLGIVGFNPGGGTETLAAVGNGGRFGGAWLLAAADRIEGIGDLDGDGRSEFVIRSDTHLGIIGLDDAGATESVAIVGNGGRFGNGWLLQGDDLVEGVGDFDGADRSGILIRSESHLGVVGLDATGSTATIAIIGHGARFGDGGWLSVADDRVEGISDLDGDGRDEIVVRSTTHLGIVGWDPITGPVSNAVVGNGGRFGNGWRLHQDDTAEGLGDFDGDGRSEIMLRSQTQLGVVGLDASGETVSDVVVEHGARFGLVWLLQATDTVGAAGDFIRGDGTFEFVARSGTHLGILGFPALLDCGRLARRPDDYLGVLDRCHVHRFHLGGEERRVVVYFDETLPSADVDPADGVNDWAADVGVWNAEAWEAFVGAGFPSPGLLADGSEVEVHIYPSGGGPGGHVTSFGYVINAETIDFGKDVVQQTAIHELFHDVQIASFNLVGPPEGGHSKWWSEGSAVLMQDNIDAALDQGVNGFVNCAAGYLADPQLDMTTRIVSQPALWWKYFTEQFGSAGVEPGRGLDALVDLMESVNAGETFMETLDAVIRRRSSGARTMQSTWLDFNVANYVKNLGGPGVSDKYRYSDEQQFDPPTLYDYDDDPATPPVKADLSRTVVPGESFSGEFTLAPWSGRYLRLLPGEESCLINLDIDQSGSENLNFSLLFIKDDDLVRESRFATRKLQKVALNQDYDEVVLVMAGTSGETDVTYQFSVRRCGPIGSPSGRPQLELSLVDRQLHLSWDDIVGAQLMVSQDLQRWTPVDGVTAENFRGNYVEDVTPGVPRLFYQVLWPDDGS